MSKAQGSTDADKRRQPKRDRKGIQGKPLGMLTVTLVALGAFGSLLLIAGFQSVLVSGQHDVDELQERLVAEQELSQILRIEVAKLESPSRILEVAQGRLGLVPPPGRMYLKSVTPGDPIRPVPPPDSDPFGPSA